MESSLISEIDFQITTLQQILGLSESLKEKCIQLEKDKNEALRKCEELKVKLERLSNRKCANCSFLTNELRKEREEKEKLKKKEKAKLLQTIAKTLESLEDGNTNHVNQLFTEIVCGKLNESPEEKDRKDITLIRESSEDEDVPTILVNETVMLNEEEAYTAYKKHPIIIPETEAMDSSPQKILPKKVFNDIALPKLGNRKSSYSIEKIVSPENKEVVEQASKKLRLSPILSSQKVSPPRGNVRNNHSARSPSVLSEIIEAAGGSIPSGQDERAVAWKMKPSVVIEGSSTSAAGSKKLKQMTLSLTRTEKKHDISLSDNFKGGVAKYSDEDNDVIQPSPEQYTKKTFGRKTTIGETLEDPDITVFNPAVTSTCLPAPAETSFDRLPVVQKSPKYKYRRETVRKKCERMRLPGQDCDQCAKYYEAAGLDQTQEVRARLNQCSRHRDKYQIRANTPPGFWDPVLPTSPENSQNHL